MRARGRVIVYPLVTMNLPCTQRNANAVHIGVYINCSFIPANANHSAPTGRSLMCNPAVPPVRRSCDTSHDTCLVHSFLLSLILPVCVSTATRPRIGMLVWVRVQVVAALPGAPSSVACPRVSRSTAVSRRTRVCAQLRANPMPLWRATPTRARSSIGAFFCSRTSSRAFCLDIHRWESKHCSLGAFAVLLPTPTPSLNRATPSGALIRDDLFVRSYDIRRLNPAENTPFCPRCACAGYFPNTFLGQWSMSSSLVDPTLDSFLHLLRAFSSLLPVQAFLNGSLPVHRFVLFEMRRFLAR